MSKPEPKGHRGVQAQARSGKDRSTHMEGTESARHCHSAVTDLLNDSKILAARRCVTLVVLIWARPNGIYDRVEVISVM